jgi:hypothetical protein
MFSRHKQTPTHAGPTKWYAEEPTPVTATHTHEQALVEADALVDDYLDHVSAQLLALPQERRAELRREIGQHLRATADAHQELGSAPKDAVRAAVRQFGDARTVGRNFARQWRRDPANASFGDNYKRALAAFGGLALVNIAVMTFLNQNRVPTPDIPSWLWQTFLVGWCILGTPVVGGWRLQNGPPSRERTSSGALALVCALATICAVLGSAGMLLFPLAVRVDASSLSESACKSCLWMAVFGVVWMPLSLASLTIGRLRSRQRLRLTR